MKLRNHNPSPFLEMISGEDALFHYTTTTKAFDCILKDNLFKFSSFKDANDPHEYKEKLFGVSGWNLDPGTEILGLYLGNEASNLLVEHSYYISFCINEFSEGTLTNLGCIKPRMWSQYGENNHGVCLVMSRKKILKEITNNLKDEYKIIEGYVTYKEYLRDTYFPFISMSNQQPSDESPYKLSLEHIMTNKEQLLLTKQSDYDDESEYRIVILKKDNRPNERMAIHLNGCLTGIILGEKFPKDEKSRVEEVCRDWDIEFRKFHWQNGEPYLLSWKTREEI